MNEKELREKLKSDLANIVDGLDVLEIRENVSVGDRIQPRQADIVAAVRVGNQRRKLLIELLPRGYPRELERGILALKGLTEGKPGLVPLLAAPFISESGQGLLHRHGINYLDLSGNAHIAFDNVLIHKTSPGNEFRYEKGRIDIFSDKASLILRELLADPEAYHTVRGLADKTSVSVGWASEVLKELEERGHIDRKPRQGSRIRRIESLLDDWTGRYIFSGKNRIRSFFVAAGGLEEIFAELRRSKLSVEVCYALTLHSGARLVSPFVQYEECHIYIDGRGDFERQVSKFVEALCLSEPAAGGNFHIVRPYYENGAFYQARILDDLPLVSDIQLYLDLFRFPSRGREQAEKILEHSGLRDSNGWG